LFKKLFKSKKRPSPDELGQSLYQAIQMGLSQQNELSINYLIDQLEFTESDLYSQYELEVVIGLMYQVIHAVSNKYEYPTTGHILNGMTEEFLAHSKEMGATNKELEIFMSVFEIRSKEYAEAEENKTVGGPAYWLGKTFLENLTGTEQNIHDPDTYMKIAICSDWLTASLVGVDAVLRKCRIKE
jgi:hypothetical protein